MDTTKAFGDCKLLDTFSFGACCESTSAEEHRDVRTEVVRCLELLPHQRCRVRGPDGLVVYVLKIPQHMEGFHFIPGVYLEADINLPKIINELNGQVVCLLGPWSIPNLFREGKWPEAFLERGYMPENIPKYLKLNAENQQYKREDENRKASRW